MDIYLPPATPLLCLSPPPGESILFAASIHSAPTVTSSHTAESHPILSAPWHTGDWHSGLPQAGLWFHPTLRLHSIWCGCWCSSSWHPYRWFCYLSPMFKSFNRVICICKLILIHPKGQYNRKDSSGVGREWSVTMSKIFLQGFR